MGNFPAPPSKQTGEIGLKVRPNGLVGLSAQSADRRRLVKVNNKITGPEEGTALHWHGFLQKETPWYDGTPSVQQCPIAPGSSFT